MGCNIKTGKQVVLAPEKKNYITLEPVESIKLQECKKVTNNIFHSFVAYKSNTSYWA